MKAGLQTISIALASACASAGSGGTSPPEAAAERKLAFKPDSEQELGALLQRAEGVAAGHVWRDQSPTDERGRVRVYVEIARGDSDKWELDVAENVRALDRVLPAHLGGYPVSYGIVPGTFGYDGDPFDALVLGPPVPGGTTIVGELVGLMRMDDEKGPDDKIVVTPFDAEGRPMVVLSPDEKVRIGAWFDRYKISEAHLGKWAKVIGWSGPADARAVLQEVSAFFGRGLLRHRSARR